MKENEKKRSERWWKQDPKEITKTKGKREEISEEKKRRFARTSEAVKEERRSGK